MNILGSVGLPTSGTYTLNFTADLDTTHICIVTGVDTTVDFTVLIASMAKFVTQTVNVPNIVIAVPSKYRFGFNGQEKVDEVAGVGNHLYFGAREYDPRDIRWWSPDPLFAKYPDMSPYSFSGDNPILYRDYDGRDYTTYIDHTKKTIVIKATYYTATGKTDDFNAVTQATEFWNSQNGKYNYTVGRGKNKVDYDIIFELDVKVVDNPDETVNIKNGNVAHTTGASSNTFKILPDTDPIFTPKKDGEIVNGKTTGENSVNVKVSQKSTTTPQHELGHTLGIVGEGERGHTATGIMTADAKSEYRINNTTKEIIGRVIGYALSQDKPYTNGGVVVTGGEPTSFDKGRITKDKSSTDTGKSSSSGDKTSESTTTTTTSGDKTE